MDDVARLLEAAPGPGLKYKAVLGVAYGAGLRFCEVVMLRVTVVESERLLLDDEAALQERLGIRVTALGLIQERHVVERPLHIGVVGSQRLLISLGL
jgi:hypothetical protein